MLSMASAFAQDLKEYQWKNRLLIVVASDAALPLFRQQLAVLQADAQGLSERKLLIFQVLPTAYRIGLDHNTKWNAGENLYERFARTGSPFTVLLIGLDGGVKVWQTDLMPLEELFGRIDAMPMRKAELRNR